MNKKVQILYQLIFFLSAFLVVFLVINPELIFHQQQIGFISDKYVWHEYLSYPGGIAEYLSVYLLQFTTSRFWGSVMLTLLMAGMVYLLPQNLQEKKFGQIRIIQYLPLLILGVLVVNYAYLVFFPFLFVLIGIFLLLFKKLVVKNKSLILSLVTIIVLSVAGFYTMGGFGFLIFGLSAALLLLLTTGDGKGIKLLILLLLLVIMPFLAAKYVFFITVNDAYWRLQPYLAEYELKTLDYILFSTIPFILFLNRTLPSKFVSILNNRWLLAVQYILVIVAFVALTAGSLDKEEKFKLEVDQLAFNEKWDAVLNKVNEHHSGDRLVAFHTNQALFHTAKMPTELFKYNQTWGIDGLLISRVFNDEVLLPTTKLYVDLAYINEAIHWGNEAVSYRDKSPQVIEQLIKAHIIEHNYEAAQLYINIMKKMPFFRKKAMHYQDIVDTNFVPQELLDKRELMPFTDFQALTFPSADNLLSLLEDRPNNKMAYEYLMSYFLLKNDVIAFANYFSAGKRFNYGGVPRIYQEALALYIYNLSTSGKPVPNVKLDKEVIADFQDYLSIVKNMNGKMDIAQPVLKDKYGSTYWYYINYDSPVTNKLEVTTKRISSK